MSVDMFLTIKGAKGESEDDAYAEAIDVLAWSFGMSQSGSMHVGGGGGSGKVSVQDISITKWVDSSSCIMQQWCCKGTHIDEASLIVRKAGDKPLDYIVIDLKEVIIASVSTGGSGGEDKLTENVSLNFKEFKTTYRSQEKSGAKKAEFKWAWNIAKNAEAKG